MSTILILVCSSVAKNSWPQFPHLRNLLMRAAFDHRALKELF